MRMFSACFECFLQSGKPCHTLRAHGTSVFKLDSIELDDVNEAEEDLLAERGGAAAGRRERKEEKRGRRERKKGKVTLWFRITGDSRTSLLIELGPEDRKRNAR